MSELNESRVSASSEARDAAVKRSSAMLLSGWRMLPTACPLCHSPLMAKGTSLHCPGCDIPVMAGPPPPGVKYSDKPPEVPKPLSTTAPAPAVASPTATTATTTTTTTAPSTLKAPTSTTSSKAAEAQGSTEWGDDLSTPFRSLEEEKREYDRSRKQKLDETSKKLGEMLLQGYTMLNAECPSASCGRVPLMKPKSGNPECVMCGKSYITDAMGRLTAIAATTSAGTGVADKAETAVAQSKTSSTAGVEYKPVSSSLSTNNTTTSIISSSSSAPPSSSLPQEVTEEARITDSRLSKGLSASERLGKYLIQGWAMLDETCPSEACQDVIPLMKNKSGRKLCVDCGFIDELDSKNKNNNNDSSSNDKNSSNTKAAVVPVPTPPVSAPASVARGQTTYNNNNRDDDDDDDEDDDDETYDELMASAAASGLLQQHAAQRLSELRTSQPLPPQQSQGARGATDKARNAILQKISELSDRLASAQDVSHIGAIAETIRKLAEALAALK